MNTTSRLRPGRRNIWVLYLAAMSLMIGAYLFVPPFKGYAVVVNLVGVASLAGIAGGIMLNRSTARLAWLLMLGGQLLYVAVTRIARTAARCSTRSSSPSASRSSSGSS